MGLLITRILSGSEVELYGVISRKLSGIEVELYGVIARGPLISAPNANLLTKDYTANLSKESTRGDGGGRTPAAHLAPRIRGSTAMHSSAHFPFFYFKLKNCLTQIGCSDPRGRGYHSIFVRVQL